MKRANDRVGTWWRIVYVLYLNQSTMLNNKTVQLIKIQNLLSHNWYSVHRSSWNESKRIEMINFFISYLAIALSKRLLILQDSYYALYIYIYIYILQGSSFKLTSFLHEFKIIIKKCFSVWIFIKFIQLQKRMKTPLIFLKYCAVIFRSPAFYASH